MLVLKHNQNAQTTAGPEYSNIDETHEKKKKKERA